LVRMLGSSGRPIWPAIGDGFHVPVRSYGDLVTTTSRMPVRAAPVATVMLTRT
jgi:hypothetical protein